MYEPNKGLSSHVYTKDVSSVYGCYTIGVGSIMRLKLNNVMYEINVKPNSLYIMTSGNKYILTNLMPSTQNISGNGMTVVFSKF